MKKLVVLILILIGFGNGLHADDGYRLWLRYDEIEDASILKDYSDGITGFYVDGDSPILNSAKKELSLGLTGLLGKPFSPLDSQPKTGIIVGIVGKSMALTSAMTPDQKESIKKEGFLILQNNGRIYIAGKDENGVLYGVFRFLQYLQMQLPLDGLNITDAPKLDLRVLNHWDNLDGTVERGYAGFSIFNWHQLPEFIDPRYEDYARANASIGINGSVVTNVNANALIFRDDYLEKAAALANIFRRYGIKIYLTARFSSPIELGGLETADPLDPKVKAWWKNKVQKIYEQIPDFGGFLVKANSEGQPGPQEYGRTHAEGANMLADALAPFGGVVMWRAFVYSEHDVEDRAKQAFTEFVPLDGKFKENVLVQVKNGPIDFQPREPIHPMFGAMPKTPLMMEFQITKEYLGQGTHLVGLASLYEEVLQTNTYVKGKGSTVAKVLDGSLYGYPLTGMAGVANIGTARNWTGNLFGQADWYSFGRLAWNPDLKANQLFTEWANLTFDKQDVQKTAVELLEDSHEACVQYMNPLGLHHIFATGHHYGPGPWVDNLSRPEWNPVYYHQADDHGIGFDRTASGSNALSQYHPNFAKQFANLEDCPPEFLLWFHHVPWNYTLQTGNTLWKQLCLEYHEGVKKVVRMKEKWQALEGSLDQERFNHVSMHLNIQEKEAKWWRDACLSYFQTFSKMEIPAELEQPKYDLEHYKSLEFPYAPGIRPRW